MVRYRQNAEILPLKEVILINTDTAMLIAVMVIGFATLVLKIIEVARSK
jgi:hypothetical protein